VSEGRKTLISVAVMMLLLAGVTTWLVLGANATHRLESSISTKSAKLAEIREKQGAIPALRQEQQRLAGELTEYETILPNDRELNKIFDTLSEYEKTAGLEIQVFNPVREKEDKRAVSETSYKRVSYDLDLVGDFFSAVRFISLLENHNRFVRIDSFSVKQKSEDDPVNEISLKLSTFVYDPKAKSAAPAGKTAKPAKPGPAKKPTKTHDEAPFDLKSELASRYVFTQDVKLRDPFTNPLTREVSVAKLEKPNEKRRLTPTQEQSVTDAIDKQLTDASALIESGKFDEAETLLGDTRKLMDAEFRDPDCARRQVGFSRRLQRLNIMTRTAKGDRLHKGVQEKYDAMLTAFEKGRYEDVYAIRADVATLLGKDEAAGVPKSRAGTKDVELAADGEEWTHERLNELVKACDGLCARADARREFAGMKLEIQGTFWTGRAELRKAAAIINGQTLSEGETVKLAQAAKSAVRKDAAAAGDDAKVVVKKIDREKITFLYRSELIERFQFAQE
jgi:Tfp pilus assembly protein PilO